MDFSLGERSIIEWDEDDVHAFFTSLGFPQYESQLKEHNISGDVLCMLDSEGLKSVGVTTIGQRLAILKAVWQLKITHNIPIEEDHYVPPSEAQERAQGMTVEKLYGAVDEQATRIQYLEEDNRHLQSNLQVLMDELNTLRTSISNFTTSLNLAPHANTSNSDSSPIRRQPSFKWANFIKPQRSPTKLDTIASSSATKLDLDSPHPSPQGFDNDLSHAQTQPPPQPPSQPSVQPLQPLRPQPTHQSSLPYSSVPMTEAAPNYAASGSAINTNLTSPSTTSITASNHTPPPANGASSATATLQKPHRQENADLQKPHRQDSYDNLREGSKGDKDNLKSFKVSLEDPTWKVLPAALKKYKINNDNWQNYAMFICYGNPGNRIERCLSYDEKPLLLFQKLKDAKKNPVFMLKHIKDIRSPIAVAQQKLAAPETPVATSHAQAASNGNGNATKHGPDRSARPSALTLPDYQGGPGPGTGSGTGSARAPSSGLLTTGLNPQTGWPSENSMLSPGVIDGKSLGSSGLDESHMSQSSVGSNMTGTTLVNSVGGHGSHGSHGSSSSISTAREIPASTGISYAVAIYPYMAEQDDEFDVVVGDTFVILSRARGWWVVQRDPTGSGIVDTEISKQGWVPAGCLLETNVPVASAIAEATASKTNGLLTSSSTASSSSGSPPITPAGKTPILPLSIISTSFPGIALMDYKKKGDEELDLAKDDALRVFKRYNHWSYAVKEESGDRGWVPSWFIGKVSTAPATPNTSGPNGNNPLDDGIGQPQVSPMSSAFPSVQSKTATVV
ncbi:Adaptor for signal transduction [Pleurotus pulmonarius]